MNVILKAVKRQFTLMYSRGTIQLLKLKTHENKVVYSIKVVSASLSVM